MSDKVARKVRSSLATAGVKLLKFSGAYNGYWGIWRGELFDKAAADGLHIMPVHYYSPIPQKSAENQYGGVEDNLNIPLMVDRAVDVLQTHGDRIKSIVDGDVGRYDASNAAFHPLDAAMLYATIRDSAPKRIIEIGSGNSTVIIAQAAIDMAIDGKHRPEVTCIEPYLPGYLKPKPDGISNIIEKPLQAVSLAVFEELESGDILFIDSTHVVAYGSDVVYEFTKIIPVLKPGVLVHVHDIFLPDDYPSQWIKEFRFFWNEQYLLQAFLTMNDKYAVLYGSHAIKDKLPEQFAYLTQSSRSSVYPGSFWMMHNKTSRDGL